jgi:hypothetical protein
VIGFDSNQAIHSRLAKRGVFGPPIEVLLRNSQMLCRKHSLSGDLLLIFPYAVLERNSLNHFRESEL